jgi:hypothetical protein
MRSTFYALYAPHFIKVLYHHLSDGHLLFLSVRHCLAPQVSAASIDVVKLELVRFAAACWATAYQDITYLQGFEIGMDVYPEEMFSSKCEGLVDTWLIYPSHGEPERTPQITRAGPQSRKKKSFRTI